MKIFPRLKSRLTCLLFLPIVLFSLCACKSKVEYFDYVSELRSNIFLARNEDFSLRAYAVEKETPYSPDGIKRETSKRTEILLIAPSGERDCELFFTIDEHTYGGDMSFDNVRAEYYFSCTLDVSTLTAITFELHYGESVLKLTANSVKTSTTLSPNDALRVLMKNENELFASLTDKYGFAGEIYIRLLYEEAPYYYIGVMDRKGNSYAFLLNATSGELLAKRQN